MAHWMKRRIQRSRARCHKSPLTHKAVELRAENETKQHHETKAASRNGTRTSRSRHK
jgi:hypothetical protein